MPDKDEMKGLSLLFKNGSAQATFQFIVCDCG